MSAYQYEAIDTNGKSRRGVIESGSQAGARRALRELKLLPVSVRESGSTNATAATKTDDGGQVQNPGIMSRLRRNRVSTSALSTGTRQLATLIASDVRIEEALRIVSAQDGSETYSQTLVQVRSSVMEGASLGGALGKHPDVFPDFYIASINAGEQSSRLPEVLLYLADFVEARHETSRKLKLALMYPALLAIISALIMTLMMIYVVPDIVEVFVTRGADLPFLTRMLIAISGAITSYGLFLLIALAGGAAFAVQQLRIPEKRLALDRMLATRRPFSSFSRQINSARFAATLATLVQSAVPLLDALYAASAVIPNRHIRLRSQYVAEQVREGGSIHRAMREAQVFPPMLVAIVASGEASRNLGSTLERAATELDREVDGQLQVLVSLVEPMVLLTMGGLVLLMVMAILMPIIGLNDLSLT